MQFASTVGGTQSAHRSGNFAMPFFHDWIRAFLIFANAPRHHIFPPYTTIEESLLNSLLFKVGAAKITATLRQDGLIRKTEVSCLPARLGAVLVCLRDTVDANALKHLLA
jgi:hypothetical protein